MTQIGYTKDLFILAFDHRGSFQSKMFGIQGTPTSEQTKEIASYKDIIYRGFKKAIAQGVDRATAGILVDEQFGADILRDAAKEGFTFASPAEKSGQNEFDFEYGSEFGAHINKFKPTFVKVLVRYNPEDPDTEMNQRQLARLKELSQYCQKNGRKFIFENLVPATPAQLETVDGDKNRFDTELRPALMVEACKQIQAAGVEPDSWKLEGLDKTEDCQALVEQCKTGGRKDVGVVILGRGADDEKVKHWLATAAQVPGFNGFAVGRTIFWEPLKGVRENKWPADEASDRVAANYKMFYDHWQQARS